MNLLSKKTPWVAASLLAAASVFAQQDCSKPGCPPTKQQPKMYDQGHALCPSYLMAAYNAPARIDVRCPWDFFAFGSFTYWQPIQENMELGIVNTLPTSNTLFVLNGDVVNMDFDYKPGFKVGLGMNFEDDNWDGLAQYTWFRGTNSTSTTLDPTNDNVFLLPMQGHAIGGAPLGFTGFFSASERWRLAMDLLDLEIARSEYVGTRLTFRPFISARAAWIRQRLSVTYSNNPSDETVSRSITRTSHSWAVGPRVGVQTNWLVGQGFRFYGNGSGDILYTRYTKLASNEVDTRSSIATLDQFDVNVSQKKYGCLRTHLDLELGLGWGTYFDNNNWHVDLAAGYGFQVFFDQNMFRHFDDTVAVASSTSPNGNLYMHGLTATVRFDF